MNTTDTMRARGMVSPGFLDIRTGEITPWDLRHNTISYEASFSMAAAFGGDDTYIPNRIGIIYGALENPTFDTISRDQSWSALEIELKDKHANVQVSPFSFSPSLKKVYDYGTSSSSSDDRTGYAVIFHSHSDSVTHGEFTVTSGIGSETLDIFSTNSRIYQAVLLNKSQEGYRVLARASLISGTEYLKKPAGFEVAIDWTVRFF